MGLKIDFLGAAGNVTGSRTLLRFGGKKFLIDCGLFQGPRELKEKNWAPFLAHPSELEVVVLTHAHLDHTGYLPKLYKEGFRGKILATSGTLDLANILLRDAAKLQEEDADYANRTGHSRHKPAAALFTVKDAEGAIGCFKSCPRNEWIPIAPDLSVRFIRSGHLVGSSFVQFAFGIPNESFLLTFSGDIGRPHSPILRAPDSILETDVLVLESTYGQREHPKEEVGKFLADALTKTFERKGVVVIPAFAVGRAQEILYLIRELEEAGRIPSVPVVLDSPMAVSATEVFFLHSEDQAFRKDWGTEHERFLPHKFEATQNVDESFLACLREGPAVVISASGMLAGGRVLHHLKKRLPDPRNTVLFVGYQAEGSKGRYLLDEGKRAGAVRIHHQEIPVNAEILSIDALSAHADGSEIIEWLRKFKRKPKKIFLNHGVPEAARALAARIHRDLGWDGITALDHEESFQLF